MSVKLKVISGPMFGREFNFTEHDVFLFGRSLDCHCCLPDDPYVSWHHFVLEVNPPECRVRDLGSLNGTYINSVKYGGRAKSEKQEEAAKRIVASEVKDSDLIKVGKTVLKVSVEAEKADDSPAACFKCGQEIATSDKEALAYIGGTYLCRKCREKPAQSPFPAQREEAQKDGAQILEDLLNGLFGGAGEAFPPIPGYEFVRELGRGGFGKVYLVRRDKDGKELALKVMLARKRGLSTNDIKRFQREMGICMELRHPYIVTLEEQGHVNGVFYFTMEYCSGGNLRNLAQRNGGHLEPREALPLMLQALDGLAYAHEKGIVHRDLKPENILLDRTQKLAKISDFGLAKNFEKAGLSGFTAAGEYAGTPPFMPKEQILDFRYVKPVSDIFSIGATFYHLLTGELVYDYRHGTDPIAVILEGKVVPIGRRRDLPKKLAAAIDKAISPEPKDRYQTAAEMKNALEKAIR